MWCNASTLVWNARDMYSSPNLGTVFPMFITPATMVTMAMNLYKLHAVWLVNLPCVGICKAIACMYVIVSNKFKTYNTKGTSVVVCTDLWERSCIGR